MAINPGVLTHLLQQSTMQTYPLSPVVHPVCRKSKHHYIGNDWTSTWLWKERRKPKWQQSRKLLPPPDNYSYRPGLVSLHAQDSTVNKSDVISVTLPSVAVTTTRNSPPVRHLYVTPQHTISPCHQQVVMHNLGHHSCCTSAPSPLLWPVVQPTCRPSVPSPLIPHISVTLPQSAVQPRPLVYPPLNSDMAQMQSFLHQGSMWQYSCVPGL